MGHLDGIGSQSFDDKDAPIIGRGRMTVQGRRDDISGRRGLRAAARACRGLDADFCRRMINAWQREFGLGSADE
jgi:poly-beta-hydroxyalkanoate depolymerase